MLRKWVTAIVPAIVLTLSYSFLQNLEDLILRLTLFAAMPDLIDVMRKNPLLYDCILTLPLLFLYGALFWKFVPAAPGKQEGKLSKKERLRFPTGEELAKCLILALGVSGSSTLWFVFVDRVLMNFSFWAQSTERFNSIFPPLGPGNFVFMMLSLVLLGPVVEELLFRGLVFNALERAGSGWLSVIGSAVLFGLFHGEAVQVIYTSLMGLVAGLVYRRTRRLDLTIAIHIINNLLSAGISEIESSFLSGMVDLLLLLMIVPMLLILVKDRIDKRRITGRAVMTVIAAVLSTGLLSGSIVYALTPKGTADYKDIGDGSAQGMETMSLNITHMRTSGQIKSIDTDKGELVLTAVDDTSGQKFDITAEFGKDAIYYDLATEKTFEKRELKEGEYISVWVSASDNADADNAAVDGYAVFRNVKGNEQPDKMPELICIHRISPADNGIRIQDDSEFTWDVKADTPIRTLDGRTVRFSELQVGQKCFAYIDMEASAKTRETEIVSSRILVLK